ncbi:MAG: hypothetical protein HC860_09995 [Alkalinema sp. RU_4_3]|nr:hypothetical protein [Alkalinema sp. RU_4_3]
MRPLILGTALLLSTITSAQAATKQFTQHIDSSSSFENLIQQAEAIAQSTASAAFSDPNTTEITINITGEQSGQIAPILLLNVSRAEWQGQQTIQRWAKYPGGAKQLLGFNRSNSNRTVTPFVTASNPIRDGLNEREANFFK